MSAPAPTLRGIWLPLVSAGLALALGVGLLAYAVVEANLGGSFPALFRGPDAAAIPQAKWEIKTVPVSIGRITKPQRAAIDAQAPRVARAIEAIYDGLFLDRPSVATLAQRTSDRRAAVKMLRSGAGVPATAAETRTLRRSARIALYAVGARQAAARVTVIARTIINRRPVELTHHATLWLVRDGRRWTVVGFNIDQSQSRLA